MPGCLDKEKVRCRAVIDSGQGSIKVCASIFDSDADPDILLAAQEGPGETLAPPQCSASA